MMDDPQVYPYVFLGVCVVSTIIVSLIVWWYRKSRSKRLQQLSQSLAMTFIPKQSLDEVFPRIDDVSSLYRGLNKYYEAVNILEGVVDHTVIKVFEQGRAILRGADAFTEFMVFQSDKVNFPDFHFVPVGRRHLFREVPLVPVERREVPEVALQGKHMAFKCYRLFSDEGDDVQKLLSDDVLDYFDRRVTVFQCLGFNTGLTVEAKGNTFIVYKDGRVSLSNMRPFIEACTELYRLFCLSLTAMKHNAEK